MTTRSDEQIARFTAEVYRCFDLDRSGQTATQHTRRKDMTAFEDHPHRWDLERVKRLADHVGGRVELARKTGLSYAQITRMYRGLIRTAPHRLTLREFDRVAKMSKFEQLPIAERRRD